MMALPSQTEALSETVASDVHQSLLNRVVWGAIFAGVATALVTQLLLNMLGVGIGAASLNIGPGVDNSGAGFSIGAGIWWVVSGIIAAFVGGLTAGRLAGASGIGTGRWHGLVSWAVSTLIVVYLLTSAVGGIVGGAFNVLGSAADMAGKTAGVAASGMDDTADNADFQREARRLVDPSGVQTAQDSVMTYIRASVSGDKMAAQAAQARAIDGLARSLNISPAEARVRLDQAQAQARQTMENAKRAATQAANATRSGVAVAGILGFIALILGAVAAWFGGAAGVRLHEQMRVRF